jgi:hypothetical protein
MTPPPDGLRLLGDIVRTDADLRARLLATTDGASFTREVCEAAAAIGAPVDPQEVEGALMAARRRRLERWL